MRAMQHHVTLHLVSKLRMPQWAQQRLTAVGFEPTPLRTGALSQRRRPLGQTVMLGMLGRHLSQDINLETGMTSRIAGSGWVCAQLSDGARQYARCANLITTRRCATCASGPCLLAACIDRHHARPKHTSPCKL